MKAGVACLLALLACASPPPEHRRAHPPAPSPVVLPVSRDQPQEIKLISYGVLSTQGKVWIEAPGAGSWWYVVDLAPTPDRVTTATFELHYEGPLRRATFEVIDEQGRQRGLVHEQRVSPNTMTNIATLVLAEPAERLGRFLVHISTTQAMSVRCLVGTEMTRAPPVEPPRCDRDHIDPTNPNCDGVYPRCDPNHPNFSNPSCCQARCQFGRMTCTSKVLGFTGKYARISLGIKDEIMVGATGDLVQDPQHGKDSDVLVSSVGETESLVEILTPRRIDMSHPERARVTLDRPQECGPRYNR